MNGGEMLPNRTNQYHDFPKNFNSLERLIVHEICDELGIKHESQGEGRKRFVRCFHPKFDEGPKKVELQEVTFADYDKKDTDRAEDQQK